MSKQVIHDCFPQLECCTTILCKYGIEVVITIPAASKPSIKSNDNDENKDVMTEEAKMLRTYLPERNIVSNNATNHDNLTTGISFGTNDANPSIGFMNLVTSY